MINKEQLEMESVKIHTLSNIIIQSNESVSKFANDFAIEDVGTENKVMKINNLKIPVNVTSKIEPIDKKVNEIYEISGGKLAGNYGIIFNDTAKYNKNYIVKEKSNIKKFARKATKDQLNNVKVKNWSDLSIKSYQYVDQYFNNPIKVFPYNGSNFYIPASSLKGSIKINLLEDDNKYEKKNINNPYDIKMKIPFERSLEDIILEEKNLAINFIKKVQQPTSQKENIKVKIVENQTNICMTIKKDQKLNTRFSNNLIDVLVENQDKINKRIKMRLFNLKKRLKKLLEQLEKENPNESDDLRKDVIKKDMDMDMDMFKSIIKNIDEIMDKTLKENEVLLTLGGNKGQQLIFDKKLEQYGISFNDDMPCGLIKIILPRGDKCIDIK